MISPTARGALFVLAPPCSPCTRSIGNSFGTLVGVLFILCFSFGGQTGVCKQTRTGGSFAKPVRAFKKEGAVGCTKGTISIFGIWSQMKLGYAHCRHELLC